MLRATAGGVTSAAADAKYALLGTVKNVTPTTGQTVAFDNAPQDQVLWITPAGTLASLTITLPSESASRLGQRAVIATNQAITSSTVTGATTILNAVSNFSPNDCFAFIKVAANTWILLQ